MQSQFRIVHSTTPVFYIVGPNILFVRKSFFPSFLIVFQMYRLRIQSCLFFELLFLSSRPLQTMGICLQIAVVGRKYLCVSRKVTLWSKHLDISILGPMFYMKCSNHIQITTQIIIVFLVLRCGRRERFQQSASTHSGAGEKETS